MGSPQFDQTKTGSSFHYTFNDGPFDIPVFANDTSKEFASEKKTTSTDNSQQLKSTHKCIVDFTKSKWKSLCKSLRSIIGYIGNSTKDNWNQVKSYVPISCYFQYGNTQNTFFYSKNITISRENICKVAKSFFNSIIDFTSQSWDRFTGFVSSPCSSTHQDSSKEAFTQKIPVNTRIIVKYDEKPMVTIENRLSKLDIITNANIKGKCYNSNIVTLTLDNVEIVINKKKKTVQARADDISRISMRHEALPIINCDNSYNIFTDR